MALEALEQVVEPQPEAAPELLQTCIGDFAVRSEGQIFETDWTVNRGTTVITDVDPADSDPFHI